MRTEDGRRALGQVLSRWRDHRLEGLMNGAAVDAVAAGKLAERCPLPVVITADLLKQLHSRLHPLCHLSVGLVGAVTVGDGSDRGGAKSGRRGGAKSGRRSDCDRFELSVGTPRPQRDDPEPRDRARPGVGSSALPEAACPRSRLNARSPARKSIEPLNASRLTPWAAWKPASFRMILWFSGIALSVAAGCACSILTPLVLLRTDSSHRSLRGSATGLPRHAGSGRRGGRPDRLALERSQGSVLRPGWAGACG